MEPQQPTTSVPSVPYSGNGDGQWSVLGAVAFVAAVMGSAMLAAFAVQTGYGIWLARSDPARVAAWPSADAPEFLIAVQLAAQTLELLLIWWLTGLWHKNRSAALGLAPARLSASQWIGAIVLLFAVKLLATAVAAGVAPGNVSRELGPFRMLVRQSTAWLLFLAAVVLAGLVEELLFRGVLSRTLEGTWLGFWGGAVVSSAAFALLHLQYGAGGQIVVFAIGMTLAWIRSRSGSLWPSIVCHSVNNAAALFVMRAIS